jgi:signal transduction histidine kinase
MDASWLKGKIVNEDVAIKNRVNDLITMLDETVETVRRITLELRPSLLDDLGLIASMEWHLGEFEKRFDNLTNLVHQIDETKLSDTAKTSLYRIFQESLTNVARHSLAKQVTIAIIQKGESLQLSIDDNGVGFDKEKLKERKTWGILGMQERMTMLGGKYDITSEMGKGTGVLVQLQIN